MPGAYLVKVNIAPSSSTTATTSAPIKPFRQVDGSYLASGYFKDPFTGTGDAHWSVLQVTPGAVARRYSEIIDNYANSFFTQKARDAGSVVPRLPADAGNLSIAALTSLNFKGTGEFSAAAGGRGGQVDIAGRQIAVVTSADQDNRVTSDAPIGWTGDSWNPILLAANDLNNLGAESVLLGGVRTERSDGTHISTTANGLVIDNRGEAINVAELLLAAKPSAYSDDSVTIGIGSLTESVSLIKLRAGTGIIDIKAGSEIDTTGKAVQGAQNTIYLYDGTPSFPGFAKASPETDTYALEAVQAYFANAAAAAQTGFVRVSGGSLVDSVQGNPYASLPSGTIKIFDVNSRVVSGAGVQRLPIKVFDAVLPSLAPVGRVNISGNASIKTQGALTLKSPVAVAIAEAAAVQATSLDVTSSKIALGTNREDALSLSQARIDSFKSLQYLAFHSSSTVDFYSNLSLGALENSEPVLRTLVFDSGGLVAKAGSGDVTLTAQQVFFENSQGALAPASGPAASGLLLKVAAQDTVNIATGTNLGRITFGQGSVELANFADVTLKSSGTVNFGTSLKNLPALWSKDTAYASGTQVVGSDGLIYRAALDGARGNPTVPGARVDGTGVMNWIKTGDATSMTGSLDVRSALTLDTPLITAGALRTRDGLPAFTFANYKVAASNQAATAWYDIALKNTSATAASALPSALLGSTLEFKGGNTTIDTKILMPGGAFSATAVRGNVLVGSAGDVNVAGSAIVFRDKVVSSSGGSILLASQTGDLLVDAGARFDVSSVRRKADGGIDTSFGGGEAGSLSLIAGNGTVSLGGTYLGEGETPDKGGSFTLDTGILNTSYDDLAARLNAGKLGKSWNLRFRQDNANVVMSGTSNVRNLIVGADRGDITLTASGVVNASGATGGTFSFGRAGTSRWTAPLTRAV